MKHTILKLNIQNKSSGYFRMVFKMTRHGSLGFCLGIHQNKKFGLYMNQLRIYTIQQLSATIVRECKNMQAVFYAKDSKFILSTINNVLNDQLALNSVDICLAYTLQVIL